MQITRSKTAHRPDRWGVLRHRDYRLFWLGQAVSGVGTFMQVVGQSLLVLKLSGGSALPLGLVSLAQALAFFAFALIGGSVVDRVDRRKLLFLTQTLLLIQALVLALLSATGTATLGLAILLAFASGVVVSFDQPARASLFPRLVPRAELPRATALNALAMTSAGTLGPALAGFTAATLGLSVNFSLNALSFVIALACLARMRALETPRDVPARQPLLGSVREGLRVVARDPALPWVVSGYGALLLGPSPQVQTIGEDRGQQVVMLLHALAAVWVQKSACEAGPGVHLRQQVGDLHARKSRAQLALQGFHPVGHRPGRLPDLRPATLHGDGGQRPLGEEVFPLTQLPGQPRLGLGPEGVKGLGELRRQLGQAPLPGALWQEIGVEVLVIHTSAARNASSTHSS